MKSSFERSLAPLWLLAGVLAGCGDDAAVTPARVEGRAVSRVEPASTAECPKGGSVVSSGVDDNGNGVLDDAEIEGRQVVCQDGAPKEPGTPGIPGTAGTAGTPGTPGEAALLARTSPVPPGDACPLGGAAVVAGRDDDGDGELDEVEIETTSYVCNAATLTRMRAEAPGEHCAGGGIAFLVGRDDDGDGALDDSEVSSTEYECSDVLSRDVEVKTANDLALLVGVRVINGSLDVRQAFQESPKIEQLDLPALEYVGGALRVVGNGGLVRVSLPALDRVGDELSVEQNNSLNELSLPSLTRVGSSLSIADTFNLADLGGLAALTEVGGTLRLLDNEALTTAELPALARAGSFAP
jgi:hypothetical protein